jgi:hypothetical protein
VSDVSSNLFSGFTVRASPAETLDPDGTICGSCNSVVGCSDTAPSALVVDAATISVLVRVVDSAAVSVVFVTPDGVPSGCTGGGTWIFEFGKLPAFVVVAGEMPVLPPVVFMSPSAVPPECAKLPTLVFGFDPGPSEPGVMMAKDEVPASPLLAPGSSHATPRPSSLCPSDGAGSGVALDGGLAPATGCCSTGMTRIRYLVKPKKKKRYVHSPWSTVVVSSLELARTSPS